MSIWEILKLCVELYAYLVKLETTGEINIIDRNLTKLGKQNKTEQEAKQNKTKQKQKQKTKTKTKTKTKWNKTKQNKHHYTLWNFVFKTTMCNICDCRWFQYFEAERMSTWSQIIYNQTTNIGPIGRTCNYINNHSML